MLDWVSVVTARSYGCNIGSVCLLTISAAYTDQPSVLSENEGSIGGCRSGQRRRSIWHLWGPSSGQKWETVWWCTFKTSCLLQSTSSHKACSPARAPTRPRQSPTQPPSTLLKSPNRYNSVIGAFGMFNQRSSSLPHYVCKHHSSFLLEGKSFRPCISSSLPGSPLGRRHQAQCNPAHIQWPRSIMQVIATTTSCCRMARSSQLS